MSELKKLLKSTIIYFIGNVATKLVSFLLIPIYTTYLTPAEYGLYDLSIAYAELIVSILFLDIWSGIMRFMFDYKNLDDKHKVISSGLIIYGSSIIVYTIVLPLANYFMNLQYIGLVYLYGLSLTVQSLYSYISRALGFSTEFAFSGIISTLVNICSNILLVVKFSFSYNALFISFVISVFAQCIFLEKKVNLRKCISIKKVDSSLLKQIFFFSYPLCINSFCYWLLTSFNKVIISNQLSVAENGYYAIAGKFSFVITLVSSCFSMAWQELAYGKNDNSIETSQFYTQATNKYFKLLFLAFLGFIPAVSIIFPYFVDISYTPSKSIIPIYVVATILTVFSTFLSNIIAAYKKSRQIFISTSLACITNVFLAFLLIPKFGLIGACISLACGYAVNCIIRILILKSVIQIKFDYKMLFYMIPLIIIYYFIYMEYGILIQVFAIIFAFFIGIILFKNDIKNIFEFIFNKTKNNR